MPDPFAHFFGEKVIAEPTEQVYVRSQGNAHRLFIPPSENEKAEPGDPPAQLPPPPGGNKHFLTDILFFFLNPLQIQIVTKYRNSCSHTKRASPHSCSFAICSALKNLLMLQINFGKVTSQ